ncbi:TetR/AcrR family transcriptional regulator [Sphingobium sp. AN558]|uniref:TetR/AcrR family transcriptional regulator n=1 Tax=Sphingobium sp. AN558 TaxID=3133442 RepID=UPI0030C1B87C
MNRRAQAAAERRKERSERRQNQILDAARACVVAEGFHVASISRIGEAASMSPGHIYQIFENKEAIMIALAEREFQELMLYMSELDTSSVLTVDTIVQAFISKLPWLLEYDRGAIATEVQVEAGRNQKIAEMIQRIDRQFRAMFRKVIGTVLPELTAREVDMRVEMLLIVARATALHAVTHPVTDTELVAGGFELALRGILSLPTRI